MEGLQRRVDAAVRAAERGTSAEIVPVLAYASGDYRGAESSAGLAGALAFLALASLVYREPPGDWGPGLAWYWFTAPLLGGFFAGWGVARFLTSVKRAFASVRRMRSAVEGAAREALELFRVRRTKGATGVLIYVSAFERMVRIQGDEAIAAAGIDWSGVCDAVVSELEAGRVAEAFETGIERAGRLLAERFPAAEADEDELHNTLRVLD